MDENEFIRVPVLFNIGNVSGVKGSALPNMVNMLVVKNEAGQRKLVVPDSFFDPFNDNLLEKLGAIGFVDPEVHFVNTIETTALGGEAHCATNQKQKPQ